jgi:hypothetical protein
MLYTRFYRIKADRVERLRSWFLEVQRREDEALASYAQEGTRHVQAHLIDGPDGPVLAFLAEVSDPLEARSANVDSRLPIDLEHRDVMHDVVAGRVSAELLYDFTVPGGPRGPAT